LLWSRLQRELPPLLAMGRNPYQLLMTAQVYAGAGGELPANRAQLFAAFVDTLLAREKKRHPQEWIEIECQKNGLAALAYAMQGEHGRGTTVEREWAMTRLHIGMIGSGVKKLLYSAITTLLPSSHKRLKSSNGERLLYLASSATLLDAGDTTVRFYHQLLQEYFAAREMGRRIAAGESLARYWPPDRWWKTSGWEETVILLAGMEEPDASVLLEKLAPVNPVVAARCLVEGGAEASETARYNVITTLRGRMTDQRQPPIGRAEAGRAVNWLGDPRPGVGLNPETGLPDIAWCQVPAGPFLMGSGDDDGMAYDDENPQHHNETITQGYRVSRYPTTNAQYAAFVEAGGYQEWRYWTDAGWVLKEVGKWAGPVDRGEPFNLPNHPVGGVSWYEVVAFCRWLTEQLHQNGGLAADKEITLPTESQWEKAARGTDGQIYPWGNEPDPNRANCDDSGIGATSAAGCFPGGASPYGVEDISGNVWEWCRTKWEDNYENYQEDNDLEGGDLRVLRGGSFYGGQWYVRCAFRYRNYPQYRHVNYGFRVVAAPFSQSARSEA
jgi:formylglycine-generating enzyme required for sulfatase activity